jgi:HAD superfamily hydrolase (TIGR01509 family)
MNATPIPYQKAPRIRQLLESYPDLRALFFDMDGTLFDTEGIHADAMLRMADRYQIRAPLPPAEVHALMLGKADQMVFELIKDWAGVPRHWTAGEFIAEKNVNVIELLKVTPVHTYFAPAVASLLREARDEGLFLALVTSSERAVTDELLRITGYDAFFDLTLTRDDCPRHKPDPWPYLRARELAGHATHEVLIFEDSPVGLEAALRSGAHVAKVEWYGGRS